MLLHKVYLTPNRELSRNPLPNIVVENVLIDGELLSVLFTRMSDFKIGEILYVVVLKLRLNFENELPPRLHQNRVNGAIRSEHSEELVFRTILGFKRIYSNVIGL